MCCRVGCRCAFSSTASVQSPLPPLCVLLCRFYCCCEFASAASVHSPLPLLRGHRRRCYVFASVAGLSIQQLLCCSIASTTRSGLLLIPSRTSGIAFYNHDTDCTATLHIYSGIFRETIWQICTTFNMSWMMMKTYPEQSICN